jgi:hypothetical protein
VRPLVDLVGVSSHVVYARPTPLACHVLCYTHGRCTVQYIHDAGHASLGTWESGESSHPRDRRGWPTRRRAGVRGLSMHGGVFHATISLTGSITNEESEESVCGFGYTNKLFAKSADRK